MAHEINVISLCSLGLLVSAGVFVYLQPDAAIEFGRRCIAHGLAKRASRAASKATYNEQLEALRSAVPSKV